MPSSIDIASNALLLIGDNTISSFGDDEPGAGATAASNLYESTKQRLLSEHPWSFATKLQRLSRLSQAPDILTGYRYAFQMPTDLIRIWKTVPSSFYEVIGDLIYSNENVILATYIYNVNELKMPPHFVKALEYSLAAEFAISVTEDVNKASLYESKSRVSIAKAMYIDSQGRPQQGIVSRPLIDARFGSR